MINKRFYEIAASNGYVDAIFLLNGRPTREQIDEITRLDGKIKYVYDIIPAISAAVPLKNLDKLSTYDFIANIEVDDAVIIPPVDYNDKDLVYDQWNLDNINAPQSWENGYTGKGVKVAVIDTGINYNHPDLKCNYKGGYNFVGGNDDPLDDHGHGTHCAGIIGANGEIKGVAPDVELYGVKVLNKWGSGSYSDVIAGIEWAVKNKMDIINMSLGSTFGNSALEQACKAAEEAGIVIVAAAGNDRRDVNYPAAYDSVIAVGAVDKNNKLAYFSSRGPELELVAPGVKVYSTYNNSYAELSGTSMASPHVAGGVALLLSKDKCLTPKEVRERLHKTAFDLGDPGFDHQYGYGLIDTAKATAPEDFLLV